MEHLIISIHPLSYHFIHHHSSTNYFLFLRFRKLEFESLKWSHSRIVISILIFTCFYDYLRKLFRTRHGWAVGTLFPTWATNTYFICLIIWFVLQKLTTTRIRHGMSRAILNQNSGKVLNKKDCCTQAFKMFNAPHHMSRVFLADGSVTKHPDAWFHTRFTKKFQTLRWFVVFALKDS